MTGATPWTPERDDELLGLWDEGHSTSEIGRRMGITKNAVIGRAHRLRLPARPSPIKVNQAQAQPWSEEDDAQLRAIYGGFLTVVQIAARMGRTPNAVAYRAANLGLKAGRRATQTRPRVSPSAQPWAGRDVFSRQTRPATTSRLRAGEPGAAASTAHCPSSLNSPEADATPPRVFSGTKCKFPLWGHEKPDEYRFCAEPVRDNAKGCASPYCAAHFSLCLIPPKKKANTEPPATWGRMFANARVAA